MSFDLLQATQTVRPSADGCAQVGEQPTSAGLGAGIGWPSAPPAVAMSELPLMPCSPPFLSMTRRDTAMESASISTSSSFIMQAEYCRRPSGERREPCGMTQVGIRRTSSIWSVYTTDTDDGTMSP